MYHYTYSLLDLILLCNFCWFCLCRDVRLTPIMVDGEVTILQELSGDDERKHVLETIDFWGKIAEWEWNPVLTKLNFIHFTTINW